MFEVRYHKMKKTRDSAPVVWYGIPLRQGGLAPTVRNFIFATFPELFKLVFYLHLLCWITLGWCGIWLSPSSNDSFFNARYSARVIPR
jgi:hypothetical protein